MEENTQYLYEYENGERVRNIGFMKMENQMDRSTLRIYAKAMDEIKGILFQRPNGETYLGTWEDMRMQKPPQPIPQPSQPPMRPMEPPQPPLQPLAPSLQQPSQPPTQPQEPPRLMTNGERQREEMIIEEDKEQEIDEYVQPRNITYEKIQRQDISRLPRKEWRLANNSFLLHGFYNYHHLLYIEEDGKIWIGVPGIYHEKEKMAANAFGFTEFRRLTDVNIELDEKEKNTYEDFGYWCRQIPVGKV